MATVRTADVLGAALKLSRRERARVAHELLVSLDGDAEPDPGWTQAWTAEIERRTQEIKDGTVQLEDAASVMADLRAKLKKRRASKAKSGTTKRTRTRRSK